MGGSLTISIFTLYKSITGGISWHEVVDPLENLHVAWAVLFTAFISFSYFAVLNVITGVFCNSAIATATRDPDMVIHSLIAEKKKHMDKDMTNVIDIDEFVLGCMRLRGAAKGIDVA